MIGLAPTACPQDSLTEDDRIEIRSEIEEQLDLLAGYSDYLKEEYCRKKIVESYLAIDCPEKALEFLSRGDRQYLCVNLVASYYLEKQQIDKAIALVESTADWKKDGKSIYEREFHNIAGLGDMAKLIAIAYLDHQGIEQAEKWTNRFKHKPSRETIQRVVRDRLIEMQEFDIALTYCKSNRLHGELSVKRRKARHLTEAGEFQEALEIASEIHPFPDDDYAERSAAQIYHEVATAMSKSGNLEGAEKLLRSIPIDLPGHIPNAQKLVEIGLIDVAIEFHQGFDGDMPYGNHPTAHPLWSAAHSLPKEEYETRRKLILAIRSPFLRANAMRLLAIREKFDQPEWEFEESLVDIAVDSVLQLDHQGKKNRSVEEVVRILCRAGYPDRAEPLVEEIKPWTDETGNESHQYHLNASLSELGASFIRQGKTLKGLGNLEQATQPYIPAYRIAAISLAKHGELDYLDHLIERLTEQKNDVVDYSGKSINEHFGWQKALQFARKHLDDKRFKHFMREISWSIPKAGQLDDAMDFLQAVRDSDAGRRGWCHGMMKAGYFDHVETVIDEMPDISGNGSKASLYFDLAGEFTKASRYQDNQRIIDKMAYRRDEALRSVMRYFGSTCYQDERICILANEYLDKYEDENTRFMMRSGYISGMLELLNQ